MTQIENKPGYVEVKGQTPHGEDFHALLDPKTGETIAYDVDGPAAREAVRIGGEWTAPLALYRNEPSLCI